MTTKQTITTKSGQEVAYWEHHKGQKPTLLLVHGFTGSHDGFQYLVPLLSEYHLVIPDLPGFGVSPLPHAKLTLRELGALLVEFAKALNLPNTPHMVGHSMGTLVVAEAARQAPQGLFSHKIVLISPVPSRIRPVDSRKLGAMASQLYYTASNRLPVVGKRIAKSRIITRVSTRMITTTRSRTERKKIYQHHFDNLNYISSISWYSRLYKEINKTGLADYLPTLELFDLYLVNGTRDSVTPLKKLRKVTKNSKAKLYAIPNVGHLSHYEKPAELATAIKSFLQ